MKGVIKLKLPRGGSISFASYDSCPDGTDFVEIVLPDGTEAYWSVDEWTQSVDSGMEVMGAIMGALCMGLYAVPPSAEEEPTHKTAEPDSHE